MSGALTAESFAQYLDNYFNGNMKCSHYEGLERLFRIDYRKYLDKTGESMGVTGTLIDLAVRKISSVL